MRALAPVIGHWYKAHELGNTFEVVAFNDADNCVEIQYFDGEIEEIEPDEWQDLHIDEVDQSKDWTGPFEMNTEDTEEFMQDVRHPISWNNPIDTIEDI